jgi:HEAT repeat protein
VKTDQTRQALQILEKDPDPLVRLWATVSLARGGDDRAMGQVEQMLASPAADVQLAAAQAWEGRPGPWVEAVRPLLQNPDGVVRLHAAQALAPVDPDAARQTLHAALSDPNPVVRLESATALDTVIERQPYVLDLPSLRLRLRDRDAHVRLTVASALLRLARSA